MERVKQQAPVEIFKFDDLPNLQIQVANGKLEKLIATTTFKFYIAHNSFAEHFVVRKNLTRPNIGLQFIRHNSVVIGTTQGLIHFTDLTMQAKDSVIEASAKPQPDLIHDNTTIPPLTTKTLTVFVDHPSEWHTAGTVETPVGQITAAESLLISHSMSTVIDKKKAFRIPNTTESPNFIKKNTQIADFFVVTREQSIFIKPVDTEFRKKIPEGDLVLNTK